MLPRVVGSGFAEAALLAALVEAADVELLDHELDQLDELELECDVVVGVQVVVGFQVVEGGGLLVVVGAPEPKSHDP